MNRRISILVCVYGLVILKSNLDLKDDGLPIDIASAKDEEDLAEQDSGFKDEKLSTSVESVETTNTIRTYF